MSFKHVLVSLLASAPLAFAAPALADGGGGAAAPGAPEPREAECLESPGAPCAGSKLLRGRTFVVRGSGLENVTKIVFVGRPTKRDDVSAGAVKRSGRYVWRWPRPRRIQAPCSSSTAGVTAQPRTSG